MPTSTKCYDIGNGVHSADNLAQLVAFIEARAGRLRGFRFKDRSDHKSCPPSQAPRAANQQIGTGNGTTSAVQLVKHARRAPAHTCAPSPSLSRTRYWLQ